MRIGPMKMKLKSFVLLALTLGFAGGFAGGLTGLFAPGAVLAAAAQNPYAVVITVNGNGITSFEIDQRATLLKAIGSIGDLQKQAEEDLINDRLKENAARLLGISLTEAELSLGKDEFAKRANLTADQMAAELGKVGVYPETFTEFVRAGLLWRKLVQAKFQSKAFVTESELDTAMALGSTSLGASVLLSELVLPYDPNDPSAREQTRALLQDVRKSVHSLSDFEDAVLTYSAAPSRENAGKLDWRPVNTLPPDIGARLLTMSVGQVTEPLELNNAFVLFQLRGLRNDQTLAAKTIAYDYATLLLPGGRSPETLAQAARIKGAVDTCNDLRAQGAGLSQKAFKEQVLPVGKVPRDIARELKNLDRGEISTALTRGKSAPQLVVLMLCARTNKISEGDRKQLRAAMFNQRLEAFGNGYLQELKGDATIIRK